MKIAFFTNNYFPITYGLTTSVEYFRRGLQELGHEVHVFAPGFRGYRDRDDCIHRFPAINFKYKMDYPIALSFYPPMQAKICRMNFDLVHCHHPFSLGKSGYRIAKKMNVPVVFTHHCQYEQYTHYVPPIIPQAYLKWHVKKQATMFANSCDGVIAPTDTIKELIKSRGVEKPIEVIATGIDWKKFQTGKRELIRNKAAIKEDDIVFLNVGRLEEEKNIDFLLKAAFVLLKKSKKHKLLFVGGGSLLPMISEQCRREGLDSQVIFAGIIPQTEIADYYCAGDIFLHSSLTETQGMTITEAMASGLAIVAIRVAGVIDQLENQETGLITENEVSDFCHAVDKLLTDEKLRKEVGENARKQAKKYDYLEKARELERVYAGLMNRK